MDAPGHARDPARGPVTDRPSGHPSDPDASPGVGVRRSPRGDGSAIGRLAAPDLDARRSRACPLERTRAACGPGRRPRRPAKSTSSSWAIASASASRSRKLVDSTICAARSRRRPRSRRSWRGRRRTRRLQVEHQLDVDLERLRLALLLLQHAVAALEHHVVEDDPVAHRPAPPVGRPLRASRRLARSSRGPPRRPSGPRGRSRERRGRGRCRAGGDRRARSWRAWPRAARRAAGRGPGRASTCATCRAGSAGPGRGARPRSRSRTRLWSGVLPKPKPGSTMSAPADAGRDCPLDRPLEIGHDLGHEVRVDGLRAVVHQRRSGRRAAAARRTRASSAPTPQTSLTRSAPASSAAAATAGFVVSTLIGVSGQGRAGARRRRARRAPAPRRVDRLVAGPGGFAADVEQVGALVDHRHAPARRRAATGSAPPASSPSPENESGVTLMMPMTNVRSPQRNARPSITVVPRSGAPATPVLAGRRRWAAVAIRRASSAGSPGSSRSAGSFDQARPDSADEIERAGDDDGPGRLASARSRAASPASTTSGWARRRDGAHRGARSRCRQRPGQVELRHDDPRRAGDRRGGQGGRGPRRRPCRPCADDRQRRRRRAVAAAEERPEVVEGAGEGRGAGRVVGAVEEDLAARPTGARGRLDELEPAGPARSGVALPARRPRARSRSRRRRARRGARRRRRRSPPGAGRAARRGSRRARRARRRSRRGPSRAPAAGTTSVSGDAEPARPPPDHRQRVAGRAGHRPVAALDDRRLLAGDARIVGPSRSMWSRSTLVITATPPSQAWVASSRPPSPTSTTARSTPARRTRGSDGGQDLELGRRTEPAGHAVGGRQDLADEPRERRPGRPAGRRPGAARGRSRGAASASRRRGSRPRAAREPASASTLPLPFVPATSAPRSASCGSPSSRRSARVRPSPSRMPNRPRSCEGPERLRVA